MSSLSRSGWLSTEERCVVEWEKGVLKEAIEEMRYEIGCMEPVVEAAQLTIQSRGLLRRWQEVVVVCLSAWYRWTQQRRG